MTTTLPEYDAAKLAGLHAGIMVFLKTGTPVSVMESIEKTSKEYFALTARLGVVLHNDTFEEYVQHFIARYHERQRAAARKAFKK